LIYNILCNLPAAGRIGALEILWLFFFFDFSEQAQCWNVGMMEIWKNDLPGFNGLWAAEPVRSYYMNN
jgi:hypothetical protein